MLVNDIASILIIMRLLVLKVVVTSIHKLITECIVENLLELRRHAIEGVKLELLLLLI